MSKSFPLSYTTFKFIKRPTKCPCRNISEAKTVYQTKEITSFVSKPPQKIALSFLDLKNQSSNKQNKSFTTRTDDIRSEHDRGRKRTLKTAYIKRHKRQ